jgi:hypothetical protein
MVQELLRDRPFNLKRGGGYGFCFVQNFFFRTTQELEYLFFCRVKREIFFPEINIRLYDKYSESDYFFFPPPKSEYFFQQQWESEYFLEKKHNPPPTPQPPFQVKWSFPYLSVSFEITICFCWGSCFSIVIFLCSVLWTIVFLSSYFFLPLHFLVFFYLRLLLTPLVSSNFSHAVMKRYYAL